MQFKNAPLHALVTAAQMQSIEAKMFTAGMPVAALMEKVSGLLFQEITRIYPPDRFPRVGLLVGPGHNGGDALVVARELYLEGRIILVHLAFPEKLKPLTAAHWQYLQTIAALHPATFTELQSCDLLIDGLFGFGLECPLHGNLQAKIATLNTWQLPIVSIDLPSGIHADRGVILGNAVSATHTFCLGLWKRGLWLEDTTNYTGKLHLLTFGIPESFITEVIGSNHPWWRIDPQEIWQQLPPARSMTTHKYRMGHLLIIAGSRQFGGAALLSALGARASGVGMITILAPESLYSLILATVPEALVIACPEQEGCLADLPDLEWSRYQGIACGMGLTLKAKTVVQKVLAYPCPIILDADALSLLAQLDRSTLMQRTAPTVLTPHWGEFCRLFPEQDQENDRLTILHQAAIEANSTILLKGARTAISFTTPTGQQSWINPYSTPALARGGSGDVLAGMIGGLLAQGFLSGQASVSAAIWHAQTALWLATQRTTAGVDPVTLAQQLIPFLGLTKSQSMVL